MPFLHPISQITVIICFILLIIILFFDEQDYLTYSVLFLMISTIVTSIDLANPPILDDYIEGIDWEVIIFLISMFTIVEILNEAHVFYEIAKFIVKKFHSKIRVMYYLICIISTLLASILEDLSVAIIFIPIIILTCKEIKTNPAPFLYGMTICINLASTLTPFGSAENVMIANEFNLTFPFFISNIGVYFVFTLILTLVLLDVILLRKSINKEWEKITDKVENLNTLNKKLSPSVENPSKMENSAYKPTLLTSPLSIKALDPNLSTIKTSKINLLKNLIGLFVFFLLLIFIHQIHVAGLLGMLLFVFLNSEKDKNGRFHPSLSKYLRKVDYKLIYFFMCLFVLVFLMEYNGTVILLENGIEKLAVHNIFFISIVVMLISSLLSGFLDNAPVTIMFLPIIRILINDAGFASTPLLIAFILGINLGGNFLPQGSAADMMTLELSKYYGIEDVNYKRLTKLGGLFALIHVVLGIIYIAFLIYIFPKFS
ncbi:SLC13 family permease [Candidatus Harpocratesius sp.]